jgi:hypothetical protein
MTFLNSDKNVIPLAEWLRYSPFQSVIFIAIYVGQSASSIYPQVPSTLILTTSK